MRVWVCGCVGVCVSMCVSACVRVRLIKWFKRKKFVFVCLVCFLPEKEKKDLGVNVCVCVRESVYMSIVD